MNMPSSTMVGTSSTNASQRSSSSNRCRRGGGASRSVVAETALIAMSSILVGRKIPLLPTKNGERDGLTSDVDLRELSLCPLHGILGGHALDGLCVHINDDVLRYDLGCLARRGPLVASEAPCARRLLVGQHDRVVAPQLVLFPIRGRTDREALLGDEPLVVDVLGVNPAKEFLRRILVLRITHQEVRERDVIAELPAGTLGQRGVQDVVLQLPARLRLVGIRLAQRLDVDRGAIERGAARPRQKSAVVVGIVPGEPAFIVGILPEGYHELYRLDRCWAVQHNRLAVCFDLFAAPGPQVGVSEGGRITEGVTQRLADGPSLCLQLLAGLAILFPRLGKFSIRVADLGKPGLSVCDLQPDDAPRHCNPLLAVIGDSAGCFVEAALALAEFLSDVAEVYDALAVKLPPIVEDADDVGA